MTSDMQDFRGLPGNAAVRAAVLRPILDHFEGDPARVAAVLASVALRPEQVADAYAPVALGAYLELFEAAARLAGDPILGARLGSRIRPGDLGPVGVLVLQSGSIWRGLQRLARHTAALQGRTEVALARAEGMVRLGYRVIGAPPGRYPQDAAFSLAAICQLIRLGFDPDWAPLEVQLVQEVANPGPLEHLFGAAVSGGQPADCLLCDVRATDRVTRAEDRDLIAVILRHVEDLVMGAGSGTLTDRVSGLIAARLGVRPVTLAALAAELGLAPRTLQRRLADDGRSLGGLLAAARRGRLAELEAEGGHAQAEIARRLGYADATALWRARRGFLSEDGVPPSRTHFSEMP